MSFPWARNYEPKNPLMKWVDEKLPLPRFGYNAVGAGYPVPRNLNYWWNFGVLAGVALASMVGCWQEPLAPDVWWGGTAPARRGLPSCLAACT